MGRMEIGEAPAANSFPDIEKLFLEAGEKARIYLIEGGSWLVEYAHELRNKPKPTKAQADAGMQSAKEDYYGSFLCLGDQAILSQGDPDPENCPFCAAVPSAGGKVLAAKAAFACNIIRYATPKHSTELTRPASVKVLAWKHADDRKRRAIKDLQNEWGNLQAHDLLITGNNQFQNYDITVAAKTAFADDPTLWQLINDTYNANKYSDEALTSSIGRKVDADGADRAIRAVMAAISAAQNPQQAQPQPQAAGVVGAAPAVPTMPYAQPTPPVPAAAPAVDLSGLGAPQVPQAAPPVPAAAPPVPAAAPQVPQAAPPVPAAAPPVPAAAPAVPEAAPPVPQAAPAPAVPEAAPPVPAAAPAVPVAAPPVPVAAPPVPPLPTPTEAPAVPQAAQLPPLAAQ